MKKILSKTLACAAVCAFFAAACSKSSNSPGNSGSSGTSTPAPTVSSITPANGPDSTIVTITGTGFSATTADDSVSFNGKPAVITSASATQLQAMVPTLAGTGNVTVTVGGKSVQGGSFAYDTMWRVTPFAEGLSEPQWPSVNASGYMVIGNVNPGQLDIITPTGSISASVPLGNPTGTAIDASGNLYVAAQPKTDSNYIYKVSAIGAASLFAIETGLIYGIASDKNGNIYAANTSNNTLDKISPQGVISVLAYNMYMVSGVATGADGSVYCFNYTSPGIIPANGVISKISPSGQLSTLASVYYASDNGILVDGDNNLYAAVFDLGTLKGSIVKVTQAGVVTTLPVDAAGASLLYDPIGIARDNAGDLFVATGLTSNTSTSGGVVKMTMH